MSPACRLFPFAAADGPTNMATDEILLENAAAGTAALRFYTWAGATVSLGYFQPAQVRLEDPRLAPLPWVRRPSGGATLVHHHEVTYCLALPPGSPWQTGEPWLERMHRIIAVALARFGVPGTLYSPHPREEKSGVLCFRHFTPGDLMLGQSKVVGSAQRKYRGALMQHGGILLAQSPHTPSLPGIRELAGEALAAETVAAAVREAFAGETGWLIDPVQWTVEESQRIAACATTKYARASWNNKR